MYGLDGLHKQDVLKNLIRDHKPNIILILETKMYKEKVEKIKVFKNCGVLEGNSGNLNHIHGDLVLRDDYMAFARFQHIKDGWLLTNIYAPKTK